MQADSAVIVGGTPGKYANGNNSRKPTDPVVVESTNDPVATVVPWAATLNKPHPANIAFNIRQKKDVNQAAADILSKLADANPESVSVYAEALRSLPLEWELYAGFQTAVTRALIECILSPPSKEFVYSAARAQRLNAGALLGELFRNRYLVGSGFSLAEKMIREPLAVAFQYEAICNVVEATLSSAEPDAIKKFYSMLSEISATHDDSTVREVCCQRVTRLIVFLVDKASQEPRPQVLSQLAHLPTSSGIVGSMLSIQSAYSEEAILKDKSAAAKEESGSVSDEERESDDDGSRRQRNREGSRRSDGRDGQRNSRTKDNRQSRYDNDEEYQRPHLDNDPHRQKRTVFLCDLTDHHSAQELREALDGFGNILRIRITRGQTSVMGYVEFEEESQAKALVEAGDLDLEDGSIRVRAGKNPISGSDPHDAKFDEDGNVIAPNSFGHSGPKTLGGMLVGKRPPQRNNHRSDRDRYNKE